MLGQVDEVTGAAVFGGVYAGTVEAVKDLGRIEVTVPAVFDQASPEATVLARPCFPYGHVYLPEVGNKVWVAFEHGDPAAPVWLGTWYPRDGMPPAADKPAKRVIESAKGHLVLLDDSDGGEAISLRFKGGLPSITLDAQSVAIRFSDSSYIELRADRLAIVNTTLVDINP
jgi:hypothetical protein